MAVNLHGKGMYIWIIKETDDPAVIAAKCYAAGLTHVLIKIADWKVPYNVTNKGVDLVPPLIRELRAVGISPWGWQFVYGNDPDGEAGIAVSRSKALGIDGFVVNAEGQYKGKHGAAIRYMDQVRAGLGGLMPIGLSSFRYPSYHPEFPWQEFLSRVDLNMPQVYWILAHNPGAQLERCLAEFRLPKYPQVPLFPTGSAFTQDGWLPTIAEIQEFMETAKGLGLDGFNFWNYDQAFNRFPQLWNAISGFQWKATGYEDEPIEDDDILFYAICKAENTLRIRTGPGMNYAIVGYLSHGDIEPIYGVENGWFQIDRGWVGGSYMTKITPPSPPVEEPTVEQRLTRVERLVDALLEIHREDPNAL